MAASVLSLHAAYIDWVIFGAFSAAVRRATRCHAGVQRDHRNLGFWCPVLRQNSMRSENSAIPCRDGCLIQVIPSPSSAKNLYGELLT